MGNLGASRQRLMHDLACKLLASLLRRCGWPDDRGVSLQCCWRTCFTSLPGAENPSLESPFCMVRSRDRSSVRRAWSGDRRRKDFSGRFRNAGLPASGIDCTNHHPYGAARSARRDWMARLCAACSPAAVLTTCIKHHSRRNLGVVASSAGVGVHRISTERRPLELHTLVSPIDNSSVVSGDVAVQQYGRERTARVSVSYLDQHGRLCSGASCENR